MADEQSGGGLSVHPGELGGRHNFDSQGYRLVRILRYMRDVMSVRYEAEHGAPFKMPDFDFFQKCGEALSRGVELRNTWTAEQLSDRIRLYEEVARLFTADGEQEREDFACVIKVAAYLRDRLQGKVSTEAITRALIMAAGTGDVALIRTLAEQGADLDATLVNRDDPYVTPLGEACIKGHFEVVKTLVELGADVNKRDKSGKSALWWAAGQGGGSREPLVWYLVEHGADVHAVDNMGESVLYRAAASREPEMVRLLLERGADPHQTNRYGDKPLFRAKQICNPNQEVIDLLEKAMA
jgi:hypothetical protein